MNILWRKTQTILLKPKSYPEGIYLQTEKGYFYVFSPKTRYSFLTKRVLDSWSPQRIVVASESDEAVRRLVVFSKMKFRNGSLLYSQASGKMYLVSEYKLRHITDPDVLEHFNMRRSDAIWVSEAEIKLHEIGEALDGK